MTHPQDFEGLWEQAVSDGAYDYAANIARQASPIIAQEAGSSALGSLLPTTPGEMKFASLGLGALDHKAIVPAGSPDDKPFFDF